MVEEIILSHSILVKLFLAGLVVGFFIPMLTKNKPLGFKKASFIYTMTFQALTTMIAFTGIVAMVTGKIDMSMSIVIMLLIWGLLMFVEIKKYKLIKKSNIENEEIHRLLGSAFVKITAVQVMLVVMMVVLKIMEAKGAISLS